MEIIAKQKPFSNGKKEKGLFSLLKKGKIVLVSREGLGSTNRRERRE
jgi:hypothetical protein